MKKEVLALSENGQITLTSYLHEPSPELPLWHTRPAVLVLPGGGYQMTSDREADPVALAFLAQGFHTFVLRYSVADQATFPNPLRDVLRALQTIRQHAGAWGVRPQQIAACGFSAGGHLAACLGTLWNDPEIEAAGVSAGNSQPNALILCYPLISARRHPKALWFTSQTDEHAHGDILEKLSCELHVGSHTPPTFLFHTYQDELVPVEHSLLFAQALAQADIPFEMHLFEHGSHGISLANELTSSGLANMLDASVEHWFPLATAWLWRLFGKPTSSGSLPPARRAHFGDPPPSPLPTGERYAETGRFTLDTALGDILDDPRARAVLERLQPGVASTPIPEMARGMPLRTSLAYTGETYPASALEALTQELAAIA